MSSDYSPYQEALFQFNENVYLCAGAGSGKTSALVKMYLSLISGTSSFNEPIPLEQIVAITFTEKAAAEMKRRVREALEQRLVECSGKGIWEERLRKLERAQIKTIHSFCAGILREHAVEASIDPLCGILNDHEATGALEEIIHRVVVDGLDGKDSLVHRLVYHYGFSGGVQRGGLKDLLRRIGQEVDSAGMSGATLERLRRENSARAEQVLSSTISSVEKDLEWLLSLAQEKAMKKSKKYSTLEELQRHYQMVVGMEGAVLIEKAEALLRLKVYLSGRWPAMVSEVIQNLTQGFSVMREAYYQLQGDECVKGFQKTLEKVINCYRQWKADRGVVDFDDLQVKVRDLLKGNRKVRRELKNRFRVVMLDEFQDTNGIQKEIVYYLCEDLSGEAPVTGDDTYEDTITLHPKKLCIVGDPKQSIYQFRGADVTVFLEMQAALEEREIQGTRIFLKENFRSHKGIVEFANCFFNVLMKGGEESYEIDFTPDDHQEHQRPLHEEGPRVELITIARGEGSEEKRRVEASALSRRILEMVQPYSTVAVYEKTQGGEERRKAHPEFSDIALLFRRFTHIKLYEHELRRRNIPYYVVKGRGFFGCQEIKDMINFLTYLEGENDEVALVGILRSPLVGVSDETLYWLLRGVEKEKRPLPFMQLEESYVKVMNKINYVDNCKLKSFIRFFNGLKGKKDRLTYAELMEYVLKGTHYDAIMLTTFQGEQKVANIRKLIELSRSLSKRESGVLRDFIMHLSKLVEEDSIEPEAQTSLENANVVRLMTIHQAKGLEFPIVFLPDIGHTLRRGSDYIVFDESKGIALRCFDEHRDEYESTMVYREITEMRRKRDAAESKRLLYVAATRARDYLVLSGERPAGGERECWRTWLDQFLVLHPGYVHVVREEESGEIPLPQEQSLYLVDQGYQRLEEVKVTKGSEVEARADKILMQSCCSTPYPIEAFSLSATALSEYLVCPRRFYYLHYLGVDEKVMHRCEGNWSGCGTSHENVVTKLSSVERGILVHCVLEHINFKLTSHKKREQVDTLLRARGYSLERSDIAEVREGIVAFLESELGMALSHVRDEHLYKEIPFWLSVRGDSAPRTIILQGVMDLLFRDRSGVWTIVDYKYSAGEMLERERYSIQLLTYALSVAKQCKADTVKTLIQVIGGRGGSVEEYTYTKGELKDFEQKVIAHVQAIATIEHEGTLRREEAGRRSDCRDIKCVYGRVCTS